MKCQFVSGFGFGMVVKGNMRVASVPVFAGALFCAAALTYGQEAAPEKAKSTVTTEEHTLPGGSKVTVEDSTRVLYQETGRNAIGKPGRRVAIFMRNNAGKAFDEALPRILEQVSALASGEDFEFIDFRDAILAMQALPSAVKTADGVEQAAKVGALQAVINAIHGKPAEKNLGGEGTTADEELLAQTSIVRLAQQLEADYVMGVSLDSFRESTRDRNFGEARWLEKTYTLTASYKLMDFGGFSIGGGTVKVSRTEKKGEGDRSEMATYAGGLDEDAATRLAAEMKAKAKTWRQSSLAKSKIPVYFDVLAMSMDSQPMYVPKFDTDAAQVVLGSQVPARIAALVEVDGVTVGTTDCTVALAPGLHKVRFLRDGQDAVAMTINPYEGLKIVAHMRVTEGEMKRIQALQKFVHDLTVNRKVNEAIVKQYEGMAEMLRNSHIRVDAKNLPDVKVMKSLF